MSHATRANAALTPRARLKMAKLIVEEDWEVPRAAERFDVSWKTAKKWADRYREEGPAGMLDRFSRPHRQPNRTPVRVVRKIVHLRWKQRLGPVEIADRLGMQSSTVYAVLVRCRLNRLTHSDRATGEPIRRYEHERPGDLLHMDVKKLGRVPDGGGWRYVGREQGWRNRIATASATPLPRSKYGKPLNGTCYLHTVIDDHSRVAYVEAHDDETKETAAAVLRNAVAWFAERGVTVQRVLTDNGGCYRSHLWRDTVSSSPSPQSEPVPTGHRPTATSSGSTAPWLKGGPSRSSTTPSPHGWPLCQHGSTNTSSTGPGTPRVGSTFRSPRSGRTAEALAAFYEIEPRPRPRDRHPRRARHRLRHPESQARRWRQRPQPAQVDAVAAGQWWLLPDPGRHQVPSDAVASLTPTAARRPISASTPDCLLLTNSGESTVTASQLPIPVDDDSAVPPLGAAHQRRRSCVRTLAAATSARRRCEP